MLLRIFRLITRELKLIIYDYKLLLILVLVPIVYTLLFAFTYSAERVTQIPTWIIDNDKSSLSRNIINAFDRHELIKITKIDGEIEDFHTESIKGNVYCCIIIPPDFEKNIKKNHRVKILTMIEASNMIIANTLSKAASEVTGTFSVGAEIKKLNMKGTPGSYTLSAATPIDSQIRLLNNPPLNYLDFLMPGLVAAVVQQVGLLGIALAFAREIEEDKIKEIHKITSSAFEVMMAKSIFYSITNFIMSLLCFYILFNGFHSKFTGSAGLFIILNAVFTAAITALGMILSLLCRNKLMATQILMLIAVPSFIISGYTWPVMSMPHGIQVISWLLPLTHFVRPIRDISMLNAPYEVVRSDLLWLWSLLAISYLFLYPLMKIELSKSKEGKKL